MECKTHNVQIEVSTHLPCNVVTSLEIPKLYSICMHHTESPLSTRPKYHKAFILQSFQPSIYG